MARATPFPTGGSPTRWRNGSLGSFGQVPLRSTTDEECELFSELMHLAAEQGRTAEEMYPLLEEAGIHRRAAR